MAKIKLGNDVIINALVAEVTSKGMLVIETTDLTTEELAALFSDKENTSCITVMTEEEVVLETKVGYTSYSGIIYGADGTKTVKLFQPADATEARISNAEGTANAALTSASENKEMTAVLKEQTAVLESTIDSILTDVIPSLFMA